MEDNTFAAVGAIVLMGSEVLLVRHTYGRAAGKLLNPGGMLTQGELPQDAIKRELMEETGITAEPLGLIALRCSASNWYLVFLCRHISGEPISDGNENSEALYMDTSEALARTDLTDTAKTLIKTALSGRYIPLKDAGSGRIMFAVDGIVYQKTKKFLT